VPEHSGPVSIVLAALAVLPLVGCGGAATPSAPTSAPPTVASTGAVPSSTSPTPTPTSVSPSPTAPSPTATPSASASPASTASGAYANQLSISEDGALSFVPLRWYVGRNAEARCREKKIKSELAWCSDYYYEKAGDRRAASLTERTEVRLLNDDLKPVKAPLVNLLEAVESEVWPNFQIVVADGKVVRITQVFTP
jgi:hypothetical protein